MRTLSAFGIALCVNALLVLAIVALNRADLRPRRAGRAEVARVEVLRNRPRVPEDRPRPEEPAPPDAAPLPALPPVDAMPAVPVVPMDLALPLEVAALAVYVPAPRVTPAAPGPRRAAAPASRGPHAPGEVDEPARWDPSNREPEYPRVLLRRRAEGEVTVRLIIDAEGRVEHVEIAARDGSERFEEAVLEVAWSWRFTPARRGGQAVRVYAEKTFRFRAER